MSSLNFVKISLVEIRNTGKSGRVEILTETFRNYFGLEATVDEIDVATERSFRENVSEEKRLENMERAPCPPSCHKNKHAH